MSEYNSLLPFVHTLPVNILRCVRLYFERKYYYDDHDHDKCMMLILWWVANM